MTKPLTIIDALSDRRLFGGLPCFHDLRTWLRWLIFLRAVYGLPMSSEEEQIFCYHTGRSRYQSREGGYPESVAITGRQAGKDRIGSVVQGYEGITAKRQLDGTELYALSIAQDQRSSLRTAHRYVTAPFEVVPALAQSVRTKRTDNWLLENGVVLASYPCRPESIRGYGPAWPSSLSWHSFSVPICVPPTRRCSERSDRPWRQPTAG